MKRVSLSEYARRRSVDYFLSFLEASNYNLNVLAEKIQEEKKRISKLLEDAKRGIIHDDTIFRVEMPGYYVKRYEEKLKELDGILDRAKDLSDLANKRGMYREHYEVVIQYKKKYEFKGFVKRFKKALEKLKDEKETVKCSICGYEGTTEPDEYGNYIHYRYGAPVCKACEEDHSLELDAGLDPASLRDF